MKNCDKWFNAMHGLVWFGKWEKSQSLGCAVSIAFLRSVHNEANKDERNNFSISVFVFLSFSYFCFFSSFFSFFFFLGEHQLNIEKDDHYTKDNISVSYFFFPACGAPGPKRSYSPLCLPRCPHPLLLSWASKDL